MKSYDQIFLSNRAWAQSLKEADKDYFQKMALGQTPKYFWIGCADSRVSEAVITKSQLGELFVHRNVANLVHDSDTNLLASLRYAIDYLKVKHIVVAGHYNCGGVKAAYDGLDDPYITGWVSDIKQTLTSNETELGAIEGEMDRVNRLAELSIIK